jgi:hypothetical protein
MVIVLELKTKMNSRSIGAKRFRETRKIDCGGLPGIRPSERISDNEIGGLIWPASKKLITFTGGCGDASQASNWRSL